MATLPSQKVQGSRIAARVQELPSSGIRRFFDLLASLDDVISLGVGEPDFPTPWAIREAAIYALERGHTSYTSNYGLLELRRAIAAHLEARYGLQYDPRSELLVTVGVSEGLDLALRALLDPGDEVLSPDPCYVSYMPCTLLAGGTWVPLPTGMESGFKVQPEAIEARLTQRSKVLLLGYPSNPTGAVLTRQEALALAEVAARHDLLVISDEIYDRLVYGGEHTCLAALPGMRERTVLLGGFSKSYAMTGWRIGYAAAPAEMVEAMVKIHQYTAICAPIASQRAALAALGTQDGLVQEMVAAYDQRRRLLVHGLNELGLSCTEPQGAFYAFPSIRSTGLSSLEFAEGLLKEERVAVVPGSAFGEYGEGHVRCCYATSVANLQEALERMARFVARLRG